MLTYIYTCLLSNTREGERYINLPGLITQYAHPPPPAPVSLEWNPDLEQVKQMSSIAEWLTPRA